MRLRRLVEAMHRQSGRGVSRAKLLRLAHDLPGGLGLTVDFAASHDLGYPLVVLRVPPRFEPPQVFRSLTPRELDVIALLTQGLANKDIARHLHISLATVKDHVHRILEKTGLGSRAAVIAASLGKSYRASE